MRLLIVLFLADCASIAQQRPALLPKPQQIEWSDGCFVANRITIDAPDTLRTMIAGWIAEHGLTATHNSLQRIELRLTNHIDGVVVNLDEAYTLHVDTNRITIEAVSPKGAYRALQTLHQLTKVDQEHTIIAGCRIIDWPAFRIRGFMHDVGRSFLSLDELKCEIDRLARYKINVFHWHLTENQAWRLESKRFPQLTSATNMTRIPGKFYTHDDVRELVDFCRQRHVMIIPEFDMPGHSEAFVRTFGHDMQSAEGTAILQQLMDEVCTLFDSSVPYIHIGTDEVAFTDSAFVPTMVAFLRKRGKKVISWNPGWRYKAGEIDMTQLWSYRGKEQPGIPAIDSRFHYLNHFDAFADLASLYRSRILNADYGSFERAGSIIALWNDRYIASERNIIIQNHLYPAAMALAERTWLGGGFEYFDQYGAAMPSTTDSAFIAFSDFETRLLQHKKEQLAGLPIAYVKQTNIRWRITDPFPNDGQLTKVFPPEQVLKKRYRYNGITYDTRDATGATIYLRHVWGNLVPAFYQNPQPNHTAYAWTYVYSNRPQTVGLWITFQNYSRSEKDLPPPSGKWDYRESRIWINDHLIQPPIWQSAHAVHSNETPLTNENFEVRPPLLVQLRQGWNKVLLKLPVGAFTSTPIRLVKWMFTCVFVTPDGTEAAEGLIYSPDRKH